MPLRFILDNVSKISFSALSRIQDDKEKLGKAVNKAVFGSAFLTCFLLSVANVAAPFLVEVVPKYQKWTSAIPYLAYFSVNAAMACVFINYVNFLNAIGKVKTTLKLMFFWTTLSWVLNLLLIYFFGAVGVGFATVLMGFASMIVIFYVKNIIKIDYDSFLLPFLSGVIAVVLPLVVSQNFHINKNIATLILFSVFSAATYMIFSFFFFGKKIKEEIVFIKNNFQK